jgi:hypothetical protein
VIGLGSSHSLLLVALRVCPEGESVMDIILSVTLYYIIYIYIIVYSCPPHDTYILGHSTAYLLVFGHILNGTAADWMKALVFIHLMQLPSNPIIFGFGWLALRCDFSKTKIQPLQ